MKRLLAFLTAIVVSLLTWGPPAHAADIPAAALGHDPEGLRAAGWRQVGPELFQRADGDVTRTVAYGEAGLRFELGLVTTEIETLSAVLEAEPSADAFEALTALEERRRELVLELGQSRRKAVAGQLDSGGLVGSGGRTDSSDTEADDDGGFIGSGHLQASLIGSQGGRSDSETDQDGGGTLGSGTRVGEVSSLDLDPAPCNHVSLSASAGPGANGPAASASASYTTTCSVWGEVYCYSYASGYQGSVFNDATQVDPIRSANADLSCSVAASVPATSNCYAQGYARIRTYDVLGTLVTYVEQETTTACADLQVGVDGTRYLIVPYGGCASASWSAFANLAGTSFIWKYDGATVASGSTYGRTFCSDNPSFGYSEFHSVQAVGSNGGQTAAGPLFVEVFYAGGGGGGGCSDPSALRPCAGEQ